MSGSKEMLKTQQLIKFQTPKMLTASAGWRRPKFRETLCTYGGINSLGNMWYSVLHRPIAS